MAEDNASPRRKSDRQSGKVLHWKEFDNERQANRQFVTALARGLEVLRTFTPHEGPLSNTEIAARTGLPKPTISRITYTLTKLGYLEFDPRYERYRLGAAVLALGHAFSSSLEVRDIAKPHMQEFADRFGVTVALAAPDRLSFIMLEICSPPDTMRIVLDVGSRVDFVQSAGTAPFLSSIPPSDRRAIEDMLATEKAEQWDAIQGDLAESFEEYADHAFTLVEGKVQKNHFACATGLVVGTPKKFLSLVTYAPDFVHSRDDYRTKIGPQLVSLAEVISADAARRQTFF